MQIFYFTNFCFKMIKTKIKKVLAIIALSALLGSYFSAALAASPIGTGSVVWDSSFDATVIWDDNFPWSATGTVSDIVVTATVSPTLDMSISTGAIDLGDLVAGIPSNGTLDIEIGTNAVSWVSITARSQSGGLTSVTDNAVQINNNIADWVQENYTFASTPNAIDDSSFAAFAATGLAVAAEVTDNSSEHTIYTTNKPEALSSVDDVVFTVEATSTAETPAGNYEDKVTLTVTGNF